jgi:hypothetical protein
MPTQVIETKHSLDAVMFDRTGTLACSLAVWPAPALAPLPMATRYRVVCDPARGYLLEGKTVLGPMSAAAKVHDGGMYAAICADMCALFDAGAFPL